MRAPPTGTAAPLAVRNIGLGKYGDHREVSQLEGAGAQWEMAYCTVFYTKKKQTQKTKK